MKAKPSHASVLVVTDNVDDANQILRQLQAEFFNLRSSTNVDKFDTDFEDAKPDVLVLAFDSIEKAQSYYLGLYRSCALASQHPHRTIVLCGKDEVQAAFKLCKKQQFDDYVLYWPHTFDGPRLAMSIWMACRDALRPASTGPDPADLRLHARNLQSLDEHLHQQLQHGASQLASVEQRADQHASLVASEMDKLSAQLGQIGVGGSEVRAAAQAAAAELEALGKQWKGRQRDERLNLGALNGWLDEFKACIQPALHANRSVVDAVDQMRALVLIVDDDSLTQTIIAKALDGTCYDTARADDGEEALARLRGTLPDVILLDVRMPGIDGLSLAQRLKAVPRLAAIPIVMMTGDANREVLRSSVHAGASAFLVKPFSRDSLNAKLDTVLRAKARNRAPHS